VRQSLPPVPRIARQPPVGVRRPGVVGAGEQLGEHHGQHDLPRDLGLRAAPSLNP
jgi:hypothetical protein